MRLRLRTRGLAVAAASTALAALVAAVVHLGRGAGDRPAPPPAPARLAQPVTTAPPTTTPPTTAPASDLAGARAAALRYLALSERVVGMGDEEAAALQRDASTAAAAPALVADLSRRLAALRAAYPGAALRYRVGALAVRSSTTGPGRARVEVWWVGVLDTPGAAPFADWRTSRYDLAWERGAWRVAAESSVPGPRPASAPAAPPDSSVALEAALAGFTSATAP